MNTSKIHSAPRPPRSSLRDTTLAGLGAAAAIGILAGITQFAGVPLLLGSFGASCVLLFGFADSPFSQPRNVIGGHVLAALVGLLCVHFFGTAWWSAALAAALAVMLMHATRTVHPPAGSNPVIVMLAQPSWSFLWLPALAGAVILVAAACLVNRGRGKVYPQYWW